MSYLNDYDDGPSPLARRHERRKKIFGWVALLGILASVFGGVLTQIFN
jgi:hypothetical protein